MEKIGASEAKTHLPRLLEKVARGEVITITKHGVPVAMLVPHPRSQRPEPAAAIEALREFRQHIKLDGLSLRELIEEGRPFSS